jgi:hypothetical protein
VPFFGFPVLSVGLGRLLNIQVVLFLCVMLSAEIDDCTRGDGQSSVDLAVTSHHRAFGFNALYFIGSHISTPTEFGSLFT